MIEVALATYRPVFRERVLEDEHDPDTAAFATRFDEAARVASFENKAPQAGEAAAYAVEYGVRGFCQVAYLRAATAPGRC